MPVLVCDLGRVLYEVSLDRVLACWRTGNGGVLGIDTAADLVDEEYRAFETGRLGESEYGRHLRARLGWTGSDPELIEGWNQALGAVSLDVLAVLGDLRSQGWYLVAAANTNPWHERRLRSEYAQVLGVFHRVVTSTALGVRKPDPRFYLEAVRGVPPDGLRLFVDDRLEYVAGARRAGLDAHLFRDAAGLRAACQGVLAGAY